MKHPLSYCVFFKTYRLRAPIPLGMILGWLESRRAYEPVWFGYSGSNQTSCYMVFHQRMNIETQHSNTWQHHNIPFTQKLSLWRLSSCLGCFTTCVKEAIKDLHNQKLLLWTVPYFIQHDDIHLPSSALKVDTTFYRAYILCLLQQAWLELFKMCWNERSKLEIFAGVYFPYSCMLYELCKSSSM